MNIRKIILGVLSFLCAACAYSAENWHSQLYLDGGRPHAKRIEVVIKNNTKSEADGDLLKIPAAKLGLVGRPAKELRVLNSKGKELMFAISPETDVLGEKSIIAVPVQCDVGKSTNVWIYFDNDKAWELPSNLHIEYTKDDINFENQTTPNPKGWSDNSKKNYYNKLETEGGLNGGKCLSTTAESGSKPDWVCISRGAKVVAGDKYKISGWVRGENVKGSAGFYIHVGDASVHKDKNSGTFDWKKVEFEGVIPEGVKYLSFGTVLYAKEGKAFFDDLKFEIIPNETAFQYEVKSVEKVSFAKLNTNSDWHLSKAQYPSRIVLSSFNFADFTVKDSLCTTPINRLTNANYDSNSFKVVVDDKEVPFMLASGNMIFEIGNVPAKSEKTFYVYISKDKKNQIPQARAKQASGILSDYEAAFASSPDAKAFVALMDSPANLMKNSSFETDTNWNSSDEKGAKCGFTDGGLFGKRAGMLKIKDNPSGAWFGMRQSVKTEANGNYILLGWARCPNGKGGTVNAHYNAKGGKGFNAYSSEINGDKWQMFSMFIKSTAEGAITAHLTAMKGDYLYDGIVLARCVGANIVEAQSASDKDTRELSAWQVDNLIKIFTGDTPTKETSPIIELAKNEDEGMQLGLRSSEAIKGLEVSATAPVYADKLSFVETVKSFFNDNVKPKLPVPEIGNVGNVGIDTKSSYFHFTDLKPYERFVPPTHFGVMYPDPILPFSKFDLEAKTTKGVYLIFSAPKDARAGLYQGNIEFKANGKVVKTMPYKIRVYDFALSDNPTCYAIFDIRLGAGKKFKNYTLHEAAKFMRSKKLSVDSIPVHINFKLENGKPVADFTKFDEEAEYYLNELKFPYLYLPFRYGTFGWANPPAPYLGETPYPGEWPYTDADHAKLNPKYREYIVESMKQIAAHLEKKGWSDRFMFYISDEPFAKRQEIEKQMIALCDMIHEGAPKMKIYCSTWYYVPQWAGKLDIWGIGAQGQTSEEEIETIHKLNADIITTTDGQLVLDNPYNALERLLPLYCYKYGFKGYEFWGGDWYTINPIKWGIHVDIPQSDTPGKHYRVRYPNGDGYIFYAGKLVNIDKPFSSLRMESHRDGVEDYEYFTILDKLAKAKNDKPALDALERLKKFAFIPNAGGRNAVMLLPDPEAYSKLRAEIARHIERLSK